MSLATWILSPEFRLLKTESTSFILLFFIKNIALGMQSV